MFKPRRSLLVVTLLASCKNEPTPTTQPVRPATSEIQPAASPATVASNDPSASPIVWTMTATPAQLTMAERGEFRLEIAARNSGVTTTDTNRDSLSMLLNGERSMNFELNWGNGRRDNRWSALPPGDSVHEGRGFGTSFFQAPGDYTLVLEQSGVEVSRARVSVSK